MIGDWANQSSWPIRLKSDWPELHAPYWCEGQHCRSWQGAKREHDVHQENLQYHFLFLLKIKKKTVRIGPFLNVLHSFFFLDLKTLSRWKAPLRRPLCVHLCLVGVCVCVFFVGMCVWHEPRPIIFWSHCINLSLFSWHSFLSLLL